MPSPSYDDESTKLLFKFILGFQVDLTIFLNAMQIQCSKSDFIPSFCIVPFTIALSFSTKASFICQSLYHFIHSRFIVDCKSCYFLWLACLYVSIIMYFKINYFALTYNRFNHSLNFYSGTF